MYDIDAALIPSPSKIFVTPTENHLLSSRMKITPSCNSKLKKSRRASMAVTPFTPNAKK